MIHSLRNRQQQPELMDQPDLDRTLHYQALHGLARINWISGTVPALWNSIRKLAGESSNQRLHVLDVACGGGATAIGLWNRARRSGVPIRVSGSDIHPAAIEYARAQAQAAGVSVDFFLADAIRDPLPEGIDVVCCSLFLHHLAEEDLIAFLSRLRESSARLILALDLLRSRAGYLLSWCGTRLLTKSGICRLDGPISVQAAFTTDEICGLLELAGMQGAEVRLHWPQRYLLTWRRP